MKCFQPRMMAGANWLATFLGNTVGGLVRQDREERACREGWLDGCHDATCGLVVRGRRVKTTDRLSMQRLCGAISCVAASSAGPGHSFLANTLGPDAGLANTVRQVSRPEFDCHAERAPILPNCQVTRTFRLETASHPAAAPPFTLADVNP